MSADVKGEIVFDSPWFQVVAKNSPDHDQPLYFINAPDFVAVVALDAQKRLLLVRQFRPALNSFTLEPPAGHVEIGETPEEAAHKELVEETGYEADKLELIAKLSPSTARFTNKLWVYFAADVRLAVSPKHTREAGVESVLYEGNARALLAEPEFFATGALACIFAAVAKGKLPL